MLICSNDTEHKSGTSVLFSNRCFLYIVRTEYRYAWISWGVFSASLMPLQTWTFQRMFPLRL